MIALQTVVKQFGALHALDGISMEIKKGSIYGLIGSNGAGKSTMLRLIAGIYRAESGMLTVDGEPVYENPPIKERVFLVSDEPYFFHQATLDSMADFYRRFYPRFSQEEYLRLCTLFALPRAKRIAAFSKGMKRQAAFLLGVCCQPDYLLLDECFDGLDPVKRQIVRKLLSDLVAEREMTAVISSHNLRELDEVCDTVGILHRGTLLYSKELDELKGELHKIQVVFLTDATVDTLKTRLNIMAAETVGKFFTLIVRGDIDAIAAILKEYQPAALETVPLNLEEVFLYEMEVMGYDTNVIFR